MDQNSDKNEVKTVPAKYIMKRRVRELLVTEKGEKLHITRKALAALYQYLDEVVESHVKGIINKLPRKTRGEKKGMLARKTIKYEDIYPSPFDE